jgi:restriction endonuclease Mrr
VLAAVCGGTLLALLFQTGLIWPFLFLIVIGGTVYFQMSMRGSAVLPLDPQEEMLAEEPCWKRTGLLAQIETLDDIQLLTGKQFEVVVADLLQELGYTEITRVGGSGDLCVDIKAVGSDGKQVAVQCKRYGAKKKVSSTEMQTFIGMIYVQHKADRGLYVTTSSYTKTARTLGENNHVELIDGVSLIKLITGFSA